MGVIYSTLKVLTNTQKTKPKLYGSYLFYFKSFDYHTECVISLFTTHYSWRTIHCLLY